MAKKNNPSTIKNLNCLNCGYPFFGSEAYCPECGQKNKSERISFGNFLREVFNGFTSWDAKFWKTLFPLLTQPGKVSKDYISGKRARYTNPFRFYLTTSIIFFLILGIGQRYNNFKKLQGKKSNATINNNIDRDSIKKELYKINIDSVSTAETKKDSIKKTDKTSNIFGFKKFNSFIQFIDKNPAMGVNKALDSLKVAKTFSNRFWYSRARLANNLISSKEETEKFNQEIISYFSIALFVLLPLFALFLKLFYIRSKKTYVEHLIFTFHTQTVFFILLIIFSIIGIIGGPKTGNLGSIFSILFGIYLFLAMRKFYEQRKFKTFVKFCLANLTFLFLIGVGAIIISFIAFALY